MKASVITASSPMPTCGESALERGSTRYIFSYCTGNKYDGLFFSMKL
jgi:hypothetical protein